MSSSSWIRVLTPATAVCLLLAGCSSQPGAQGVDATVDSAQTESTVEVAPAAVASGTPSTSGGQLLGAGIPGVDISLGEWALVPSATEARPGTITFRFRNFGTVPHALRIRTSGSGRDRLEWRADAVAPGESGILVANLAPGTYDIDCPIEDGHGEHDQLGMEMSFTVHEAAVELAPLAGVSATSAGTQAPGTAVTIAGFAFEPTELRVAAGTTVTWSNTDPTSHTVQGVGFDTGVLEPSTSGSLTFEFAGTFDYLCAIHPTMQGRVVVEP